MAAQVLSWNINGLRSQKVDIKQFLDNLSATIICFQETKVTRDMLEEAHAIVEGYSSYFSFSKIRSGYSGVATYCKSSATPTAAQVGLSGRSEHCIAGGSVQCLQGNWHADVLKSIDDEGRCVITVHRLKVKTDEISVAIINVYCPRVDPEKPERKLFKLQFLELLRQRAESLRKTGLHVIIVGDINISHKLIDHCDPEDFQNFDSRSDRLFLSDFLLDVQAGEADFGKRRNKISTELNMCHEDNLVFRSDFQMIDTYRYFHPNQKDAFTCWNTKANARATNYGTRIDYILCDSVFVRYVNGSQIRPDVEGSDHCPVAVQFRDDVEFRSADKLPPVCTKFFPEFKGNQQKLQSYFKYQEKSKPSIDSHDVKRKLNSGAKPICKQMKLSSFFNVKSKTSSTASPEDVSTQPENRSVFNATFDDEAPNKTSSSFHGKPAANWNFLYGKPKPPPLCNGHREPSVMRTSKKKGVNFNRQFYACAHGAGRAGDPNAQCGFFMWC